MRRFFLILMSMAAALSLSAAGPLADAGARVSVYAGASDRVSEHPFDGLSVKGYSIDSAWPASFRSVRGKATIKVNNSGESRDVSGITAKVYRNGALFAEGECSDVSFAKGQASYQLTGTVTLADGVSVWQAIGAALSFRPSEYTVDVYAVMVHEDGGREQISRIGVPVTKFIH